MNDISANILTKSEELNIEPQFGPDRPDVIKHSNSEIRKARRLFSYDL